MLGSLFDLRGHSNYNKSMAINLQANYENLRKLFVSNFLYFFLVLTGLMLLFTFSAMGTVTMWFTNMFQKRVESTMVLSEYQPTYEMWRKPPVQPPVKIYIFNFTNVEDFEMGRAQKLHVQELGPYVYFEEMERVNVRFSKVDGTVSFQERRRYR